MTQHKDLSLRELANQITEGRDFLDRLKKLSKQLEDELHTRFSAALSDKLKANSASSGTIEVDGHKIKGAISKTVKWDNDKLKAAASVLSWEEIEHYFKIAFSISETVFKGTPPGPLKKIMADARTVKYDDLKVSLEPPKDKK